LYKKSLQSVKIFIKLYFYFFNTPKLPPGRVQGKNIFALFKLLLKNVVSLRTELTEMNLLNNNWWWQILPVTGWR